MVNKGGIHSNFQGGPHFLAAPCTLFISENGQILQTSSFLDFRKELYERIFMKQMWLNVGQNLLSVFLLDIIIFMFPPYLLTISTFSDQALRASVNKTGIMTALLLLAPMVNNSFEEESF